VTAYDEIADWYAARHFADRDASVVGVDSSQRLLDIAQRYETGSALPCCTRASTRSARAN
jgi:hypothetical protein